MSFSLTTPQFLDGSKTVTRRMGWLFAKAGDYVMGIEKGMGLKKGEKVKRLGEIEIINVRRERLYKITAIDVVREGFPNITKAEFIAFYREANHCSRFDFVTRIEFKRVRANV